MPKTVVGRRRGYSSSNKTGPLNFTEGDKEVDKDSRNAVHRPENAVTPVGSRS